MIEQEKKNIKNMRFAWKFGLPENITSKNAADYEVFFCSRGMPWHRLKPKEKNKDIKIH